MSIYTYTRARNKYNLTYLSVLIIKESYDFELNLILLYLRFCLTLDVRQNSMRVLI
jgi:hypothetical protein